MLGKKREISDNASDRENLPTINRILKDDLFSVYDRLDIMTLETHFEKWFREEDSLQAFLNPKIAK